MTESRPPGGGSAQPQVVGRPLAPQQRGLWFLQQLRPGSSEYNVQIALRLRGPLRVGCLENALNLLAARHEPLRATIAVDASGNPLQYVRPTARHRLTARRPTLAPGGDPERCVAHVLRDEVARPFDLAREMPMRAFLYELGEQDHLLTLTFNHLAIDGVSLEIVSRELSSAYASLAEGKAVELPELAVSFTDYARWIAERAPGEEGLEFWRRELDGVGDLRLPADRSGHGVGAEMITIRREVAGPTLQGLARLARETGTSLFALALGCYALLLHRTTGQLDFAVGMPVAGRTEAVCEPLVGCFLNTVCVRVRIEPDRSARHLARTTARALARALQHQGVPFADVVRAVRAERTSGRHPLFGAFCSALDDAPPGFEMAGVRTEVVVAEYPVARFDLNATFALGLERPAVQMEFSSALFERSSAERLADQLVRVLDWVAADPDRMVAALPVLGHTERGEVLDLLNGRRDG